MTVACKDCKYFDRNDNKTGMCRFDVPVVIPVQSRDGTGPLTRPFTAWPLVRNEDWCGNFTATPK